MVRKELNPAEKRLKEQQKYADSHGGQEIRVDTNRKYFCLKCGSYICDEGCSKLNCPSCDLEFGWKKCIIETPFFS